MKKNYKKGETLIEVTIAVGILAIVLITTFKILGSATFNTNLSIKKSQALSFSREGIEMVRYIRNLNYINNPDKLRICWNFLQENNGDGLIDGDLKCEENSDPTKKFSANFIMNGVYVMLENKDLEKPKFFLSEFHTSLDKLDVALTKKGNKKMYMDLKDFQLCKEKSSGLTIACNSPKIRDIQNNVDKIERLGFFRAIKIEYINLDGTNYDLGTNEYLANYMKITSSVIFPVGDDYQEVFLTTILSDNYQRSERDR